MPADARPANHLLAALPADEWRRLRPATEVVPLLRARVLTQAGGPVTRVYFPTSGVISALIVTEDGGSVEALLAGREGAMGVGAALGFPLSPWRLTVQAVGDAIVVAPGALADVIPAAPTLQRLLLRYAHAMQQLATQSIACNRFHALSERAARWLLMMLDRVGGDEVEITQEFLAQMLGTHRPSMTLALATLEHAGLIRRAGRGRIVVPDRAALEAAACECYRRVAAELRGVTET